MADGAEALHDHQSEKHADHSGHAALIVFDRNDIPEQTGQAEECEINRCRTAITSRPAAIMRGRYGLRKGRNRRYEDMSRP